MAPSAADASVCVRALTKRFPVRRGWGATFRRPFEKRWITSVDGVSFDVGRGEFFGLLGPNGAGKTTLLKMLATFITPDAGEALVEGVDVAAEPERARALVVPVIASERSLYWRLTARENLELFARLWRVPAGDIAARVDDVLGVVDLRDTATKLVGQFSSGMMQRLLIARALLADPRVLLLDEPTRSLDPISARSFRRFLREELAERRQCAVIIATHSAEEAFDLCHRVAVLDGGRLLALGVASELAQELAGNRYVAWTTQPGHPLFATHAVAGDEGDFESAPVALRELEGWHPVALEIRGGAEGAAALLAQLVTHGIPVAALERVPVSLAALIDRVVRRSREGA
ncbi:MAG TPA: ABC transporter ATP-binding protein [Gemmatimonadaceae bacterium]|nr:ABC transporter ATP-binding protein [Gemmatimonadaceae bacterium]